MSKIGNYVVGLQDNMSTSVCHICEGYGKVEVQLAADRWREDDCDLCNGSGELVESEDE
tara:strand:+ start:905 stop:1081 length:177 start_codon:yes stop_codon:yes gene_type:complete